MTRPSTRRLLQPLLDGHADAVFGSRYLAGEQMRVLPFWHSMINKGLTLVSNMFCNLNLTDMETCYKVFRTDLLKSVPIRSDRFGFEPEITMKSAKRKFRIYEVPISYHGRTYEEGKKIGWRDGLKALGVILKFWLIDDLYAVLYGRGVLNNLTGTPQYLSWLARKVRPHVGDTVLEIGAGIGNLSGRLMARRLLYVAAEKDPLHLHALRNRFLRTPNVVVQQIDPEHAGDLAAMEQCFDTVLCLNVLEYVADPGAVVRSLRAALKPNGMLVVLAPQGPGLFGSLDRRLGHKRRYRASEARQMLEAEGFVVETLYQFNKAGTPTVVDVRQDFRLRQNQQSGAEDLRQNRVAVEPDRPVAPVAGTVADRSGPQFGPGRGGRRRRAAGGRSTRILAGMNPDFEPARLQQLVAKFSGKRILVVGDLMLDEFVWGKVSRISPEAPVPVVNVIGESYYPGGAANVARNVRELTPHTMILGRVGADRYGCQLRELMAGCGIDTSGVLEDASVSTTVKTRVIARNQQVVRVDRESPAPLGAGARRARRRLSRAGHRRCRRRHRRGLWKGIPHAAVRRTHSRNCSPQCPGADGGPPSAHVDPVEGRNGHETEPAGGVSGGRPAAFRSGDAGPLRRRAAGSRPAPARAVAAPRPSDHAGRAGNAAIRAGRGRRITSPPVRRRFSTFPARATPRSRSSRWPWPREAAPPMPHIWRIAPAASS